MEQPTIVVEPKIAATGQEPFFVVGIGASAGGLTALEEFFGSMPTDTGAAFVVVQHLSPNFESQMDKLLARHTRMPVCRAEDGMSVVPNKIYLLATRQEVTLADGCLRLQDEPVVEPLHVPIDHFFFSLAKDSGAQAIAVVLSGTGSDGSRGLRAVHEAGGLVMVQSVPSAKFDGMPTSAIYTGMVDLVTSPDHMGKALAHYVKHPQPGQLSSSLRDTAEEETAWQETLRLLNEEYGIDFSCYKPSTIQRRMERRIVLSGNNNLEGYNVCLREDDQELQMLKRDFLIGVTRFFRDDDTFEKVADLLPEMIAKTSRDQEFRVWIAGCSTGEEAYSIAILVDEAFRAANRIPNARIFATDVDRGSLAFAAAGIYPASSIEDVAVERRTRYFTPSGTRYQVIPEVRNMVVFAPHNLLADTPFTRMDLVSCRNLLIYFTPIAQQRVLRLLHYALAVDGVLLLGPSESVSDLQSEFDVIDSHHKLFRKLRHLRLPVEHQGTRTNTLEMTPTPRTQRSSYLAAPIASENGLLQIYDALLELYIPGAVLVDPAGTIVHVFGQAADLLRVATGRASNLLVDHLDGDLRIAVSGALQRVQRIEPGLPVRGLSATGEDGLRYEIIVRGIVPAEGRVLYLVLFQPFEEPESEDPSIPDLARRTWDEEARDRIRFLEEELRFAKANLQATIQELESSNEELQATNEEMVASNEELQSTNEELHSVNEELYTVNSEYQSKIDELMELSNDMENLFNSTRIHTIFLDRELRLRKFTPGINEVFDLLPSDIGRRIDSFAHSIDHWDRNTDFDSVLETGETVETQVRSKSGAIYLMRILPYVAHGTTSGVVMTLIDISHLQEILSA